MRGPSQNILYDKKQRLPIYCVNKEVKPANGTIYSVMVYMGIKSKKIKLDKEKKKTMLWEKISEKLSERNWTVYKLCLKAGI